MAEQARITFAATAIKDLEDMQAYYLGEGVPDVGKRLTGEIVAKIVLNSSCYACHAADDAPAPPTPP